MKSVQPFFVGLGLLLIPFFSLFVSSILFLAGFSLNSFIFPSSVLFSLLVIVFLIKLQKNKRQIYYINIFIILLFLGFAFVMTGLFFDYSYDGQDYHQYIIYELTQGWNPFHEHSHGLLQALENVELWTNHYAKGLETVSATISCFSGNIELGKAVNFILFFSSGFFVFVFLKNFFSFISYRKRTLLTLLIILSPTVIVQLFTFYNDWSLYSLFLILISSLFSLTKKSGIYYWIIGIIVFLASNIKFNILFWIGFFILLFLLYFLITKKKEIVGKLLLYSFIGGMAGVFIGGFNPYITNIRSGYSPLYPLAGEGKVDIMINNTPMVYQNKNRVEAIFISLFSLPNANMTNDKPAIIQIIKDSGGYDTRRGGFGPFFIIILLGCCCLYASSKITSNKERRYYHLILIILFISLLILPSGWWARYVPFFYIFPLIMLLYSEKNGLKIKWMIKVKSLIYVFLILNSCIIGGVVFIKAARYTARIQYYLNVLQCSPQPVHLSSVNASFNIKIKKNNIPVILKDDSNLDFIIIFDPEVKTKSSELNFECAHKPFLKKIEDQFQKYHSK